MDYQQEGEPKPNEYIMEISVMEVAAQEIKDLRQENLFLSTRLKMFDDIMMILTAQVRQDGFSSGDRPDVLTTLKNSINDLKER